MYDLHKDNASLKRLIHHEDSEAAHQLEERISKAENEEHLVRAALERVAFLAALSVAGVSYTLVLLPDFLQNKSQFILKLFVGVGLASGISLVTFAGLWVRRSAILDEYYRQCRTLISAAFEGNLKQIHPITFPQDREQRGDDSH